MLQLLYGNINSEFSLKCHAVTFKWLIDYSLQIKHMFTVVDISGHSIIYLDLTDTLELYIDWDFYQLHAIRMIHLMYYYNGKDQFPVENWVNYVTSTFDLTHDIDLWFFKVQFQNSGISGIVIWLMWTKKKANQLDTGLTAFSSPLPTPMSLTL